MISRLFWMPRRMSVPSVVTRPPSLSTITSRKEVEPPDGFQPLSVCTAEPVKRILASLEDQYSSNTQCEVLNRVKSP